MNYNGGGGPIYNSGSMTVAAEVATVTGQLESTTAGYAALTANNNVTIQGGNTAVFDVTSVNANGVAVFSVAASTLAGLGQYELNINTVSADVKSIIINVTGTAANSSFSESANFIGSWGSYESTTLWNFSSDFTSISTGTQFDGASWHSMRT